MKWLNRIWPWSAIEASRTDIAKWHAIVQAQNSHSIFMEQMAHFNGFYTFLYRALGDEKMMALANQYNAEIAPPYGFIGALGRPDKVAAQDGFPPKGTGEVDSKLGPIASAMAQQANKQDWNK